ncbi:MAG: universal stress protein [Actinomycetia bacterium]|nr:universal stress protein [Actinomycetes bacterium]MCP4960742.1 universal stress protein [Actinomycetes bacterium]
MKSGMAVGIDGSAGSVAALKWALATDASWGPVTPVAVWQLPWWEVALAGSAAPVAYVRREHSIDEALDKILADESIPTGQRDRLADRIVLEGRTVPTLLEASAAHELLVVGTRERGAVADTVLGSVSIDCASQTKTPLAVVPHDGGNPDGPVVVGIDGSDNSARALGWVLEHIGDDVPVVALGAWSFVVHGAWQELPVVDDRSQVETREAVEAVVDQVCNDLGADRSRIVVEIDRADPRSALHAAGGDARLLVVGARGLSGWQHLVIGSVTTALLHQPVCPTIVIPGL